MSVPAALPRALRRQDPPCGIGRALAAIAAAAVLGACTGGERPPAAAETTDPRRIVALTIGSVDTLDVLGELHRAIAVEADCHVAGTEHVVKIRNDDHSGPSQALNIEAVIALRPDLVVAKEDLRPALATRGLPVFWVPARSDLATIAETVVALGDRIGVGDKARATAAAMRDRIAALERCTAKLPRVRVYYEAGRPGRTAGDGTLMNDLVRLAGGINIAAGVAVANPTMSAEAIIAADPEVIVLSPWSDAPDAVARRPGWDRISAVRTRRIHQVREDRRQIQSPSPRCVEACERELLAWLHPGVVVEHR